MNTYDKCGVCGADFGLHHGDTLACPAHGDDRESETYLGTRFTPKMLEIPFEPPAKRARDMTLRDWFAGQALVGIIIQGNRCVREVDGTRIPVTFTEAAYDYADAMLKERGK